MQQTTQSRAVGNAALAGIKKTISGEDGPARALAFLWAGFDAAERRRVCYLSRVPMTVGQGEYEIERVIDDWFDFTISERGQLRNALEQLAKLGQRITHLLGVA